MGTTPENKVGRKATQLETERRVRQVYEWMSEAKSRPTIIRLVAENWGQLSDRMVDEYIKRARAQIVADWSQVDRKEWVAQAVQQMQKVAELSIEQKQHSNAIGAISMQAKLLGVTARDN